MACAQASDGYGSWGGPSYSGGAGANWADTSGGQSSIINGQVTLQTQWSNLNTVVDAVGGDAAFQGAAAGNLVDIMTMNNTLVNNNQFVGSNAAIGSSINANVSNVWGSVGFSNQALCNGASVSTDPVLTSINSRQECHASDPATSINANITGVVGDMAMQSLSMGNTFEADSNAQNMPIRSMQINSSLGASNITANVSNIGGSMSMTSGAIGNKAQILHYSTN
ncbi:MAG: hypothetical protein JO256_07915 [Alphaproteobacteria bacterium]|nr:hypothetical protein [Alphaproteobacteria bacterium]